MLTYLFGSLNFRREAGYLSQKGQEKISNPFLHPDEKILVKRVVVLVSVVSFLLCRCYHCSLTLCAKCAWGESRKDQICAHTHIDEENKQRVDISAFLLDQILTTISHFQWHWISYGLHTLRQQKSVTQLDFCWPNVRWVSFFTRFDEEWYRVVRSISSCLRRSFVSIYSFLLQTL